MRKSLAGFTVVELLIVIVVIVILALISIAAYDGIQESAYNTRIISGVRNYQAALDIYKAKKGRYPQTTPDKNGQRIAVVCLGTGYVDRACGRISGVDVHEDEALNAEWMALFGSTPMTVNDQSLPSGPEAFVGAVYGNDTVSYQGYSYARTIQYALHGANAACKLPGAYSYRLSNKPAVTACEIVLEGIE